MIPVSEEHQNRGTFQTGEPFDSSSVGLLSCVPWSSCDVKRGRGGGGGGAMPLLHTDRCCIPRGNTQSRHPLPCARARIRSNTLIKPPSLPLGLFIAPSILPLSFTPSKVVLHPSYLLTQHTSPMKTSAEQAKEKKVKTKTKKLM